MESGKGRLQTRSWQDKEGQNRKTTEVVAEHVQFGPRPAAAGDARPAFSAPAPQASKESASADSASKEDMPFDEDPIPQIDIDDEIKAEDIPF